MTGLKATLGLGHISMTSMSPFSSLRNHFINWPTHNLLLLFVSYISGVYSSSNWPPFTRGQNSILNWVLKLNPWKQKIKSNKNCLKSNKNFEKALFIILLFNFRCHQRCKKSVQKEKLHSREQNVCPRQTSFLPYFFWINLLHQFSK